MPSKIKLKRIVVVGDRLKDFSIHEETITISELENLVNSQSDKYPCKYIVSVGQGIAEKRLKGLCKKIINLNLDKIFKIKIPILYTRSNKNLTHKHVIKNIMISNPSQDENGNYISALMLDDNAAEMSDHSTGQHIQGMVLIEAARQMVIAVTKKYLILENNKNAVSFITHNTNAIFNDFIFPLPVTMKYEILKLKKGYNDNIASESRISFIQNEIVAAEIIFKYSALNSEFVKEKEDFMANKNIQAHFNNEQFI
jgi:hypothetical protein